jgi:hypothetical protein
MVWLRQFRCFAFALLLQGLTTNAQANNTSHCQGTHDSVPTARAFSDQYKLASAAFNELKATAALAGKVPLLTDPCVADILAVLSDSAGIYGSPDFPADLQHSQELCQIPIKIAIDYLLHDFGIMLKEEHLDPIGKPAEFKAKLLRLMKENAYRYQKEVVPMQTFGIHCIATSLPALSKFIEALSSEKFTPIRRNALRKMRGNFKEMIVNGLNVLADDTVRGDLRLMLFEGIRRDLPNLTQALSIDYRFELRNMIEVLRPGIRSEFQLRIDDFLKALADTKCEGLCRL